MDPEHRLEELVARMAQLWDAEPVAQFARRLAEQRQIPPPEAWDGLLAGYSPLELRLALKDLLRTWQGRPDISPADFALRIACSARACQAMKQHQAMDLVWTGPFPPGFSARRTEQALLDVIGAARRRVWLASYAFFQFESLIHCIRDAVAQDVQVNLLLETDEHGDLNVGMDCLKIDQIHASLRCNLFAWRPERRMSDFSDRLGVMHSKFALADDHLLLISSANLTDAAMIANMELGVVVTGGHLPRQVGELMEKLSAHGHLVQV